MTDLYVRRGDPPDTRRRAGIILALVVLAALLGVGLRYGCARTRTKPAAAPPERDLLELGRLPDPAAPAEAPTKAPAAPAPTVAAPASPPAAPSAPPPAPSTSAAARPTTTRTTPSAQLAEAQRLRDEGKLQEARDVCLGLLASPQDETARGQTIDLLGQVGMALLLTPRPMPEKVEYTVQSGDSLAKLAKRFNTTVELIQKSNTIAGSMIRVGDRLRIFQGTFTVSVSKSLNQLDLFLNGQLFKRYRVGTGEYNRTPVGEFTITDRIPQPTWWRPDGKAIPYGDPQNELGTHWLSLNIRGYGLHGTWEPDTIGRQASAGCIRLLNEEIEELYSILPLGTAVSIVD